MKLHTLYVFFKCQYIYTHYITRLNSEPAKDLHIYDFTFFLSAHMHVFSLFLSQLFIIAI